MDYPIPEPRAGYVRVECVWPAERGEKNDCKGGTPVVWAGTGDVQLYPTILWPKLAGHPDVWRLYDADEATIALRKAAQAKRDAETEAMRLQAEADEAQREAEEQRLSAARAQELGQGTNTDVVTVLGVMPVVYTVDSLAEMTDEQIHEVAKDRGYGLHPRLTPANLRVRFLEAQDTGTASSDEPAAA